MTALQELPEFSKDALFPIIKFSPWATSKDYSAGVGRLIRAYGNRPVIADIDDSYASSSQREAVDFQSALVSGDDREALWSDFISNHDNLIPCIRPSETRREQSREMFRHCHALRRGLVIRLNVVKSDRALESNADYIFDFLQEHSAALNNGDCALFIDCGYIPDLHRYVDELTHIVRRFAEFEPLPIILCSGTFPSSFTSFTQLGLQPIRSRLVFQEVVRNTNYPSLRYSDLSSTRLGSSKGGGGRAPARVDLPSSNDWIISRSDEDDWTFQDAAIALMRSEYWPQNPPNIYGIQRIINTAENGPARITTLGTNAATRINIHLFVQSNYGNDAGLISTDEDWSDL